MHASVGIDDDCDGSTDGPTATCPKPGVPCVAGKCVDNCAIKGAAACPAGTVCNVSETKYGQCVKPTDGCVITGETVKCGLWTCGPGTECHPQLKECVAALPCFNSQCKDGYCAGASCPCQRGPKTCTPAPLAKLNQAGFVGGLVDLDMDLQCGAWGVTVISGPDYLRYVAPDGTLKAVAGVTNLNMGEVAQSG